MRGKALGLALLGLAVVQLTALGQTTPATKATTPAPKAISPTLAAATVNGEPIYEVAVQRALQRLPPEKRDSARAQIIDYLAANIIIDQSLRAVPAYKVDKAQVDKKVNEMKAQMKAFGRDFGKMLADLRVSEDELRQHIAADLRWFKYATAQATDKALMELFTREKEMFDGTMVRARHILITPKAAGDSGLATVVAEARALRKTIEAEVEAGLAKLPASADKLTREKARGELLVQTFAKYAKSKSECPTKAAGGDVNWFQKAGLMVAPFANAAFALQVNQMSDVVRTPFGVHLILVTERKPGQAVEFKAVKDVVKEVYFDRLHDYVAAQLRAKAKVVVNPAPK